MRLPWRKHDASNESRAEEQKATPSSDALNDRAPARAHSADGPIRNPADDLLGREPFARALADDIRLAPRESGFVIGLTGEWGGGKTSILQLVAAELRGDLAAVVTFNPWLFSGAEQLVTYFFAELSSQLEETDSQRLGKVATALSAYGRVVSPLRYVPYFGELFRATSEGASSLGTALKPQEPSANEKARNLREQLVDLRRPVLILVDDLDRLRPEEIVDVVRLVRLVGDFPNLVYLVAFDRLVVESAIAPDDAAQGHAYLEKIIHISHALPPVRPEDLTAVLVAALEEAIPRPADYRYDSERLDSLFWSQVRLLFGTVRDVRRFVNLLRTTLELIGDEVDLADVLALEALRLFEPDAFDALVAARYPLTGTLPSLDGGALVNFLVSNDEDAEREQIELITAKAKLSGRVEGILKELFPRAARYLDATLHVNVSDAELKAARRVGAGEVFDIYLFRRLAPSALPSREVEEVLGLFRDRDALRTKLESLEDDAVRALYLRLADYAEKFPPAWRPALEAVMHRGVGFSDSFGDMSGSLLLRRLLDQVPAEDLPALLRDLDYPNLSRRYELLRAVEHPRRDGPPLAAPEVEALKAQLVEQVLAETARDLAAEPDLGPLIGLTGRHSGDLLRARLPDWLPDDDFLVRFVAAHQMTKVAERNQRTVQLDWPALIKLVPADVLGPRLEMLDPEQIGSQYDADTLVLWQQALRYVAFPEDAEADLRGWPRIRSSDDDDQE